MEKPGPLGDKAFIEAVRNEFSLTGDVSLSSLLVDELDLDSLDLINLVAFSEELSGRLSTNGEFPVLVRVSDAYSYYTSLLEDAPCQP
jgi:hypothetical protein